MPTKVAVALLAFVLSGGCLAVAEETPDKAAAAPKQMSYADAEHLLSTAIASCIAKVRDDRQRSQPIPVFKQGIDDYPPVLRNHNKEAVTIVASVVDALGNARFVHVDRILTNNEGPVSTS